MGTDKKIVLVDLSKKQKIDILRTQEENNPYKGSKFLFIKNL